MKKHWIWLSLAVLALCTALVIGGIAYYEGELAPVTVVSADTAGYDSLADIPLPGGIFCGWFTTAEGAAA